VGLAGSPLDGFVFQRRENDGLKSWAEGVTIWPSACGQAHPWPGGCEGAANAEQSGSWVVEAENGESQTAIVTPLDHPNEGEHKAEPCDTPQYPFRTFTLYYPEGCNTADNHVDWMERARQGLDTFTGGAIMHELATGWSTGNPSLQSTAENLSASVPVHPVVGMSTLADAWQQNGKPGGVLMSGRAGLIPHLNMHNQLDDNGNVRGLGWPFMCGIPGDCPGTPPIKMQTGAQAATATTGASCMYLHGPGFYGLGPLMNGAETADRDARSAYEKYNKVIVIAERTVLVAWLPCLAYAVEVQSNVSC